MLLRVTVPCLNFCQNDDESNGCMVSASDVGTIAWFKALLLCCLGTDEPVLFLCSLLIYLIPSLAVASERSSTTAPEAQISIATKESVSAAFTSFDQGPELFKVVDDKIRTRTCE